MYSISPLNNKFKFDILGDSIRNTHVEGFSKGIFGHSISELFEKIKLKISCQSMECSSLDELTNKFQTDTISQCFNNPSIKQKCTPSDLNSYAYQNSYNKEDTFKYNNILKKKSELSKKTEIFASETNKNIITSKYLPHIKEFDEYKKNENVKSEYNTIEKFNNQIRNMIDIFLKDNTTIYVSYSLKNDGKDVSLGQLTDYFEAKNYQREYITVKPVYYDSTTDKYNIVTNSTTLELEPPCVIIASTNPNHTIPDINCMQKLILESNKQKNQDKNYLNMLENPEILKEMIELEMTEVVLETIKIYLIDHTRKPVFPISCQTDDSNVTENDINNVTENDINVSEYDINKFNFDSIIPSEIELKTPKYSKAKN